MTIKTVEEPARQPVKREVLCCMSSIVSTLAAGYGVPVQHRVGTGQDNSAAEGLANIIEQAFELSRPIPDYEEAAIQAGWSEKDGAWRHTPRIDWSDGSGELTYDSAEECCHFQSIEPYNREVYEHWAVTHWFANKLIAAGEKVDTDFAGLCVWARTTTGQAIYADSVIERIAKELL